MARLLCFLYFVSLVYFVLTRLVKFYRVLTDFALTKVGVMKDLHPASLLLQNLKHVSLPSFHL